MVPYLPVRFDRFEHRQNLRFSTRDNRVELLMAFRESIEVTLSFLAELARTSFVVEFSSG